MDVLYKLLDHKAYLLMGIGGVLVLAGLLFSTLQHGETEQKAKNPSGWIETTGIILDLSTYKNSLPMKQQDFFSYKIGYAIDNKPVTSIRRGVPGPAPFKTGDELPVLVDPANLQAHYFSAIPRQNTQKPVKPTGHFVLYGLGMLCLLAGGFFFLRDTYHYRLP